MTSYEEEFLSTGQEARRLSIALLQFIQIDDPEWKNKYQKYLSLRFRPALSTLEGGTAGSLGQPADLHRAGQNGLQQCDGLVELFDPLHVLHSFARSITKQQEEILSFLMKLKKDRFGFHDREFTL